MERFLPPLADPPPQCRACPLRGLGLFAPSESSDLDEVQSIRAGTRRLKHGDILHAEGDPVRHAFTLFDGYATRYRLLSSGQRQVLQFVLTGDLVFHLEGGPAQAWPDTIEVVGHAVLCALSAPDLQRLFQSKIRMAHQISAIREAEKRLLEEHMMDMAQRSAFSGVGRLLLELFLREKERGRTRGDSSYFPFRQQDIADALGLSSVHVSRVYAELRGSGLMEVSGRRLTILNCEDALRRLDYEPSEHQPRPLL